MTPKRLRYIAHLMRAGMCANTATTIATAGEIDLHADELERFIGERGGKQLPALTTIRLKEPDPPRTVFNDLKNTLPEASKGMR